MKVPEKNPLETDKNNDINDVSLYRKKKKKAKRILPYSTAMFTL